MSFSHLLVDGSSLLLRSLPEGIEDDARVKVLDLEAKTAGLAGVISPPVTVVGNSPFFVPAQAGLAPRVHFRTPTAARFQLAFGNHALQGCFRGRTKVATFVCDAEPHSWSRTAPPAETCVLGGVASRTLAAQALSSLLYPSYGSVVSTPESLVKGGKHVAIMAARVAAFAVEHALAPFGSRLRPSAPGACYLWTGQSSRGDDPLSIRTYDDLKVFLNSSVAAGRSRVNQVVYVGMGVHEKGMALLAALGRNGGPVFRQTAELLDAMGDAPKVLLVGDAGLLQAWPAVQADDYLQAIDEAVHLLVDYNNFPLASFEAMVAALENNLLIPNVTLLREARDAAFVETSAPGAPLAVPVSQPFSDPIIDAALVPFTDPALAALPQATRRALFAQALHQEVLRVPPNVAAVGTLQAVPATPVIAHMLGLGGVAPAVPQGAAGNFHPNALYFDPAPVEAAAMAGVVGPGQGRDYTNHWSGFAGRSTYIVFERCAPNAAAAPNAVHGAAAVPQDPFYDMLQQLGADDANHAWQRLLPNAPRPPPGATLAVVYYHPIADNCAHAAWAPLNDRPGGFDFTQDAVNIPLGGVQQMAWLRANSRRLWRFVENHEHEPEYNPLRDASLSVNNVQLVTTLGKWASLVAVLGKAWWSLNANARCTQWATQYQVARGQAAYREFAIPDEFLLYWGNARVMLDLPVCGGLWAMAYLEKKMEGSIHETYSVLNRLRSPSALARHLLYMRAAAECATNILNVSPARVSSGQDPCQGLPANVSRAIRGAAGNFVVHRSASAYAADLLLSRAAGFGDKVAFSLVAHAARGVQGMYHADLRPGAGQGTDTAFARRFLRPEVLTAEAVGCLLGVARPSLVAPSSTHEYLQGVLWQGEITHRLSQPYPELSLDDDVKSTVLMLYASAFANDDWAIKSWRPSGGLVSAKVQVPLGLIQNNVMDISAVELRTVFPFRMVVSEWVYSNAPAARGAPRLAAPATWADVPRTCTEVDATTAALTGIATVLNDPPYYNFLSQAQYHSTKEHTTSLTLGRGASAPHVFSTGAQHFVKKCLLGANPAVMAALSPRPLAEVGPGSRMQVHGQPPGTALQQQTGQLDADTSSGTLPQQPLGSAAPSASGVALMHDLIRQLALVQGLGGLDGVTAAVDAARASRGGGGATDPPRTTDFQSDHPGGVSRG